MAREEKAVQDKMQQDRQDRVQTALVRDENERVLQEIVKNLVGRPDWSRELIQEMTRDKQSMDQLATLIAVMGPEASRSLFRNQMTEQAYIDHWNRVVEDEERQLATGRAYAISQPYEVSIDLALLDLDRPR